MNKTELEELTKLEELEKKYFQELKRAIEDKKEFIRERLEFINDSQENWKGLFKLDNEIQKGAQEIVRAIIFRAFLDWKPFSLPISSDTAFETNDAVINLDIKTVKNIDNDAKQGYLQVRRNQISYPNKEIRGVSWKPHQPTRITIKSKIFPTFSYFVKFIWAREGDKIIIKEIVICSVPNGELSKIYGDDFLINYKTYAYKDKGKTERESGDTARFNIRKIAEPKLTKGWKRLEYINLGNQTNLK